MVSPQTTEIVVVGGGVEGSCIAWHLARAGAQVNLIERWEIGTGASGASAGGVRQQGRDFREFPLAFRALDRWKTLEEELGTDLEYRRGGHAITTEREDDLPILRASVRAQQIAGLEIEVVEGDALRDLIPGLAPTVLAAAYSPNDGHANSTLTTQAFARAAEREGAVIRTGEEVTSLVVEGGRITGVVTDLGQYAADVVVLAAGAWSNALAAAIGVDLHCTADAYQAITTFPVEPHLVQVLGSMNRLISLKQLPDGRYLLGGGWPGEFSLSFPRGKTIEANIIGNQEAAIGLISDVARAVIDQAWIGIDNHGHDEVPVLGTVDGVEGLVVATGFSGHGFALAPAVGEAIAGLIMTGESPIDISQLGLARFDGPTDPSDHHHAG